MNGISHYNVETFRVAVSIWILTASKSSNFHVAFSGGSLRIEGIQKVKAIKTTWAQDLSGHFKAGNACVIMHCA